VYNLLLTLASALLVAFGGSFCLFDTELISIESELEIPQLHLVCLILGTVVLLHRINPAPINALLSVAIGPRTWSANRGFRSDPGLQVQPFLIPAFLLVLWATLVSLFLLLGIALFAGDRLPQLPTLLLLLSLVLTERELWRIGRESFERSLRSSRERAA